MRELMTIDDLARLLKLSKFHLYRLEARGLLPKVRGLGRVVRFDPDEIEKWLKSGGVNSVTNRNRKK